MRIVLPWPPKELSANTRKDRRYTGDKRKAYRAAGFFAAANQNIPPDAHLSITFHPPDRRKRDLDNMLSSIKYGLDGVAAASGVDDYGWSISIRRADPIKGGQVVIEVAE